MKKPLSTLLAAVLLSITSCGYMNPNYIDAYNHQYDDFIGIELDDNYFEIAQKRIHEAGEALDSKA